MPFGMVQLSPDTRIDNWDGSSGYHSPEAELRCVAWKSGKVMWSQPDMGRSSLRLVEYGGGRILAALAGAKGPCGRPP